MPISTTRPSRPAAGARRTGGAQGYWRASRAPRYALPFALPLLAAYEGLALLLGGNGGGLRNGADALLRGSVTAVAGPWAPVVLAVALIGGGGWLAQRDRARHGGGWKPAVFAGMLAESTVLAVLLGGVIALLTAQLLGALSLALPPALATAAQEAPLSPSTVGPLTWVMLSLGAGLYEELVFRVLLVSGVAALAWTLFGWSRRPALAAAVLVSAVLFAAAHHVGPLGEPWRLEPFAFRFVAGLVFSLLYALRGFGIAAWTHALYDVWVGVVA